MLATARLPPRPCHRGLVLGLLLSLVLWWAVRLKVVPSPALWPLCAPPHGNHVIAFSLYGSATKYHIGAVQNVVLAKRLLPEWRPRFYIDEENPPPADLVQQLKKQGAEIISIGSVAPKLRLHGLFWRFLAAADPSVAAWMIRDTDSRHSAREAAAVSEWLDSCATFHVMRDHPAHAELAIPGGLWGGKQPVPHLLQLMNEWARAHPTARYGDDQRFLARSVWPAIRPRALQHDSFACTHYGGRAFPTPRVGLAHVGQSFDEWGEPVPLHLDILRRALPGPLQCTTRSG